MQLSNLVNNSNLHPILHCFPVIS